MNLRITSELIVDIAYGNQRLLEIACALATRRLLLILDEPAGGMNDQKTEGHRTR